MLRLPELLVLIVVACTGATAQYEDPGLEPVAETRLLMEGLNQSNFRGLDRLLNKRPENVETWAFIRGQSLLVAETGNLLMLRPPRNQGAAAWNRHSAELRTSATDLARHAARQDYPRARLALVQLATSCNRCHQTFRVRVEVKVTPANSESE
jgi:hypothetical protein